MDVAQTKLVLEQFPRNRSVMLVAKHGVGKSSVVKAVADSNNWGFYDVRLSQCEVGDIKGLPYLDKDKMRTTFLKPAWWPRGEVKEGILFFDELNRASKDVLQAVFEICLDRRLDGEALPDGWRVVAAINGDEDYDVVDLDPALLDRWFIINFEPTDKEWMDWARKSGIHDSILEFVSRFPEFLDPPTGGKMEAGKVYPSRRSWDAFNQSCQALDLFEGRDEGLLTMVCKGWLGDGVSVSYPPFLLKEFSRLRPGDILDKLLQDEIIFKKVELACADMETIATIANSVMAEAVKKAAKFKVKQEDNLKKFFMMIPSDVAASIWKDMMKDSNLRKLITEKWKNEPEFDATVERIFLKM